MSDLLSVASPRTGELLAGRYRLIERVGTGGMARVYRARDELLARDVAVKLFPADGAQHSADTLRRAAEAKVLAALSHPSLVTLYDAHVESGETAFLVMEFVDGPTLRDRMDAGDLDGDQIRAVLSELAAALATVHAGGVVHRDVKPSNVLLRPTPDGTATQTVLADFGVAHFIDAARLTSPGTVIGTAAYLAPEQVRGEPPLPASDVYALGLVVLEALTGQHPFGNHSVQATILARLARQPDMPPALAADWAALLTAMTAHEPAARPTAAEVAARAAALGNPGEPAALRAEQATARVCGESDPAAAAGTHGRGGRPRAHRGDARPRGARAHAAARCRVVGGCPRRADGCRPHRGTRAGHPRRRSGGAGVAHRRGDGGRRGARRPDPPAGRGGRTGRAGPRARHGAAGGQPEQGSGQQQRQREREQREREREQREREQRQRRGEREQRQRPRILTQR